MRFLMISQAGEGAQILRRIELEGNAVEIYIKEKTYKNVFDGILNKVDRINLDGDLVVIFDTSGFGDLADKLIKKNVPVYGASSFMDKLEHDREFGLDMMQMCGIKVPDYVTFKSLDDGIKYVRETNKRLVFKPSGSMPCKLTFVAEDKGEMLEYLEFVKSKFADKIDSFILQEFVEGALISSEAFCDGKKFLNFNHTVEVKKFLNNDLGPSTGCSGNLVWPADDYITEQGIKLAEELCIDNNYRGQLDLNAIVNDDGVFGLEWTPRFGYDATPLYTSMLHCELGKFFSDIARGQGKNEICFANFGGAIRLTIPPYPIEPEVKDTEYVSPNIGIPIRNWEEYEENLYFYEVMLERDRLVHSAGTGVIALAMGFDSSCDKIFDFPREILDNLKVPDKQYRTDLGKVLPKMYEEVMNYA